MFYRVSNRIVEFAFWIDKRRTEWKRNEKKYHDKNDWERRRWKKNRKSSHSLQLIWHISLKIDRHHIVFYNHFACRLNIIHSYTQCCWCFVESVCFFFVFFSSIRFSYLLSIFFRNCWSDLYSSYFSSACSLSHTSENKKKKQNHRINQLLLHDLSNLTCSLNFCNSMTSQKNILYHFLLSSICVIALDICSLLSYLFLFYFLMFYNANICVSIYVLCLCKQMFKQRERERIKRWTHFICFVIVNIWRKMNEKRISMNQSSSL